jgi:hypothetical protein
LVFKPFGVRGLSLCSVGERGENGRGENGTFRFVLVGAEEDMRKGWGLLVALLVVLVLAGVAVLLSLDHKRPEVSLTTLVRLDPGMTEAEVADLLGPPTDDVTGRASATIRSFGRLTSRSGSDSA